MKGARLRLMDATHTDTRPDMSRDDQEVDPWLIDAYTCLGASLQPMSTYHVYTRFHCRSNPAMELTAVEDRAMPEGVKTAPGYLANQGGGIALAPRPDYID